MTRMPRVTGAHVVRSLGKVGFEVVRQRGSHAIAKHPDGRSTVYPFMEVKRLALALCPRFREMSEWRGRHLLICSIIDTTTVVNLGRRKMSDTQPSGVSDATFRTHRKNRIFLVAR